MGGVSGTAQRSRRVSGRSPELSGAHFGSSGTTAGRVREPFLLKSRSLGVQLVPETQFLGSTATRTHVLIRKIQRVGKIQSIRRLGAVAHKFARVKAFEDSGPSRTPERVMRRNPSQKLEQFDDFMRRGFRIRRGDVAADKMKTWRNTKESFTIS